MMSNRGPIPEYLKKKRKYKRGAPHTHPQIEDFDKEVPKYPCIHEGKYTVTEGFYIAVKTVPNRPCMKYRPIKEVRQEEIYVEGEKKLWNVTYFRPTVTFTYKQIWDWVVQTGDGLQQLCGLRKGSRVCIFEDTRYEWFLIAHGGWRNGFVITTAYANLGLNNLVYCLNKTKCPVMFLNAKNVDSIIQNQDVLPHLKYLFYLDSHPDEKLWQKKETCKNILIRPFKYLLNYGKQRPLDPEKDIPKCGPEDNCVLMFTSGSTGVPKAVMVKNKNFMSALYSAKIQLAFREETVFLAYLPLAHILELEAENCVISTGGCLCFGNRRTLIRDCHPHGDIQEFAPTVMLGVPRVWDTVKKRAFEIMTKKGGRVAEYFFNLGFEAKRKALYSRSHASFWNFLLFDRFSKSRFGGRIKMIASGAAPLSSDSHEFMAALMDVPFPQGYGLTEVCGAATGQDLAEFSTDNVGYPITCAMVKLVSVPEMGYLITDEPCERGEICIHGPIVSGGYFEEPEKTEEAFRVHEDGRLWFHTGDIGMWRPDNQLAIIDRKKNIIKLAMGEYVAVLALEAIYMGDCPFVAPNGIFVHADPTRDRLVAVMQPMKSYLLEWARANGKKPKLEELIKDEDVNKVVLESLKEVADRNKLKRFEQIRAVQIVLDTWDPHNGLMTASFKLRRKPITDKYKDLIEELFQRAGAEVDKNVAEMLRKKKLRRKKEKEAEKMKRKKREEEVEGEEEEKEEIIVKKSLKGIVKKKDVEEEKVETPKTPQIEDLGEESEEEEEFDLKKKEEEESDE